MTIIKQDAFKLSIIASAANLLLVAPLMAQTLGTVPAPGSAGTIDGARQTQPSVVLPGSLPTVVAPQKSEQAETGPRIRITTISLRGNTQLSTADLLLAADITQPFIGGDYSLAQLQTIAAAMTALYRAQGYAVATVVLPSQEIQDGQIQFLVFEGILEQTHAQPDTLSPELAKRLHHVAQAAISQERRRALRQADVERAIMVAAEVMGMHVTGNLEPGPSEGGTVLRFQTTPVNKVAGAVRLDSAGAASTGKTQLQIQLAARNLATPGDVLTANLLTTEKTSALNSYALGYELPIGVAGWRLGGRVSQSKYQLGGTFTGLGFTGKSEVQGMYASYALHRRFNASVDVRGGYNQVTLHDSNGFIAQAASTRKSNVVWIDLRGNFNDQAFNSTAYNQWGVAANFGDLAYSTTTQRTTDAATLKRAGNYQVITADFLREQLITGPWAAQLVMRGQSANKNLDSYHKFRLGGANGVRAFAEGEAAGDIGHLVRAELAYTTRLMPNGVPASSRLSVFYDQGQVQFNHTPQAASTANNTGKRAGYGLQWQYTQQAMREGDELSMRVFWAKPTGNTKRSDADNKSERVGLELGYRF